MTSPDARQTFDSSVRDLLRIVTVRRVADGRDLHAVGRLRYEAYLRDDVIEPNASKTIIDKFDDAPGTHTFMLEIEGRLAGSIRLSLGSAKDRGFPAMGPFPDELTPLLDAGATMIDPTRFVLDLEHARRYPKLVYAALRLSWMISDHLVVDYTLATVRTEHQAFYRRFFGHGLVCPPRPYLMLKKPLSLMVLPCRKHRETGLRRYPFLDSSVEEFEALWPVEREAPALAMDMSAGFASALPEAPAVLA